VLAYVAYAMPPVTREERAGRARIAIVHNFHSKQQVFLDFVPGLMSVSEWMNSIRKNLLRC
jgi:hypothetical protein